MENHFVVSELILSWLNAAFAAVKLKAKDEILYCFFS